MLYTSLTAKKCQEIQPPNILPPFIWEKVGRGGIDHVTTASQKKAQELWHPDMPLAKDVCHEDE